MVLPTRFYVRFHTPTCETSLFYWIFVQRAQVYQYMKFDPIPDQPNKKTQSNPHANHRKITRKIISL